MSIADTHMSVTQAAEYLYLTRQQVLNLCKDKKLIGAEQIGEFWVIPRESVEVYKYLQRKKYQPRSRSLRGSVD